MIFYQNNVCIATYLQLKKYFKEFLADVYPGATKSPTDFIKMMAMPDIEPDTAIEGIKLQDMVLNYFVQIIKIKFYNGILYNNHY